MFDVGKKYTKHSMKLLVSFLFSSFVHYVNVNKYDYITLLFLF